MLGLQGQPGTPKERITDLPEGMDLKTTSGPPDSGVGDPPISTSECGEYPEVLVPLETLGPADKDEHKDGVKLVKHFPLPFDDVTEDCEEIAEN